MLNPMCWGFIGPWDSLPTLMESRLWSILRRLQETDEEKANGNNRKQIWFTCKEFPPMRRNIYFLAFLGERWFLQEQGSNFRAALLPRMTLLKRKILSFPCRGGELILVYAKVIQVALFHFHTAC